MVENMRSTLKKFKIGHKLVLKQPGEAEVDIKIEKVSFSHSQFRLERKMGELIKNQSNRVNNHYPCRLNTNLWANVKVEVGWVGGLIHG